MLTVWTLPLPFKSPRCSAYVVLLTCFGAAIWEAIFGGQSWPVVIAACAILLVVGPLAT